MRTLLRKKIILQVPYYNQLDPSTGLPPKFRNNGCAIVCMKMVLEYLFGREFDINLLQKEVEKAGGRDAKGNWTHAAEVNVLKQHDLLAWRRNWNLTKADEAYLKTKESYDSRQLEAMENQNRSSALLSLQESIKLGYPVIASVKKHFQHEGKRHQVVIVGFDEGNVYINDPIAKDPKNHPMKVKTSVFLKNFNYQAIFISR